MQSSSCNAFNGTVLREQVTFPPYGTVLCDLEDNEHNVELTFITVEKGNTSLVLLWLCECKLEIVLFFCVYFKNGINSSKGSWKLNKIKPNANQTEQSSEVNVQWAWTVFIWVQAFGPQLRSKYWEKNIN